MVGGRRRRIAARNVGSRGPHTHSMLAAPSAIQTQNVRNDRLDPPGILGGCQSREALELEDVFLVQREQEVVGDPKEPLSAKDDHDDRRRHGRHTQTGLDPIAGPPQRQSPVERRLKRPLENPPPPSQAMA